MWKKNNIILLLLLLIFLIPGIIGLLHSGFPTTDDGGWMIIRFASFYQALRHGQVPVRFLMSLNHGYGYPVADFLYPLFMYLGVPVHVVGVGFINTIKVIIGLSFIFSGIFTFFWLQKLFRPISAFVGGIVYAFFPYHLFDIYQRGSVGEVLALGIVPFIFWQIERGSLFLTSIGIAALILAHNTLALLFLPVIVCYICLKLSKSNAGVNFFLFRSKTNEVTRNTHLPAGRQEQTAKNFTPALLLLSIPLSLGLSAFFWIPALYDSQYTVFHTIQVSDFSQYFLSTKSFSLVGIFALMISIICVSFAFKKSSKHDLFFLFITYVGLFFSLPISTFLWNLLPLPQLVQFPFRFLSIVILGIAFLSAYMLDSMKTKINIFIAGLCIFLTYFSAWSYISPKSYQEYPDSYYATNQDTTTVKNEYMPRWVKQIPLTSAKNPVELVQGMGNISGIIVNNANKVLFTTHISSKSTIAINVIYFPGWNVFIHNKEYPFSYNNPKGIIQLNLPSGNYLVTVRFGETNIRAIADGMSLVSILILFITCISLMRKLLYGSIAKLLKQYNNLIR